ncbi:MAG: hypothetical protein ACREBS_11710 [Nitrososphaerales archaeon]
MPPRNGFPHFSSQKKFSEKLTGFRALKSERRAGGRESLVLPDLSLPSRDTGNPILIGLVEFYTQILGLKSKIEKKSQKFRYRGGTYLEK